MRSAIQQGFEKMEGMNSFVCAPERLNPMGLNLVFQETEDGAETKFCIYKRFQSYPGYVHGGVLSSIVDETMGYASVFKKHLLPFTVNLALTFRFPMKSGETYTCRARILKWEGRRYETEAAILDSKARRCLTAKGLFFVPTIKRAKEMMFESHVDMFRDFFYPDEKGE